MPSPLTSDTDVGGARPLLELVVFPAGGESEWRLWPDSRPLPSGTVQENAPYCFELRNAPNALSIELSVDDERLDRDVRDQGRTVRWRWNPGFNAGEVNLRLAPGPLGPPLAVTVVTDPNVRKLTRTDFDTMVREILDDSFALFTFGSHRLRVGRGTARTAPPIARLEFLRSRVQELETIVRCIDQQPLRVLRAQAETVPIRRAQALTASDLSRSLRGRRLVSAPAIAGRLPHALQGRVPETVVRTIRASGLDIREHRDIRNALTRWAAWLRRAGQQLAQARIPGRSPSAGELRWAERCGRLADRLDRLRAFPLFDHVQSDTAPIRPTPIYAKVELYRRFFTLHRDFEMGIANVTGDYLGVPLARTYDLYELWVYLRLVRASAVLFPDIDLDTGDLVRVERDELVINSNVSRVRLGNGVELSFQRRYFEFWTTTDRRGSFTRTMIPDISLVVNVADNETPSCLIVLDAKYRIENQIDEALASIHMYRDALVAEDATHFPSGTRRIVSAAYLLSPHIVSSGETWQSARMPGRIFHPEFRSRFQFGAVSLRPGMTVAEIATTLAAIIADGTQRSS